MIGITGDHQHPLVVEIDVGREITGDSAFFVVRTMLGQTYARPLDTVGICIDTHEEARRRRQVDMLVRTDMHTMRAFLDGLAEILNSSRVQIIFVHMPPLKPEHIIGIVFSGVYPAVH